MMDKIWEFIKLIPLFVCKYANIALQWLQQNFGETVVDFFDSIGIIGCAVILLLAIGCWVLLFKISAEDTDDDSIGDMAGTAFGWISLFFYGFLIIWIVGMLTHPLNDSGSFMLNTVFEQKTLVSFADKTIAMLPALPAGSTVTLDNFLYWHDFLAIGAIFVMAKFAFTTIASILRLRIVKLVCFWIVTLSFVVGGMMCGSILTWCSEASGFPMGMIGALVCMAFYMVPMLVVWVPVTVVYCGPVIYVLSLILSPILHLLGLDAPVPETKTEYKHEVRFSFWHGFYTVDHTITRNIATDALTSVTSIFTFF